ncbi:extensin family protein [uncultured Tateyamaria sp.]|uniref:extensin-like domain-containing protein n=1 Tax=uncultured Tateyamaria sp. TaxID=455651 RepID=UPI002605C0B4|nr:extensin family protein [uncultured Tateyamaria sp.]
MRLASLLYALLTLFIMACVAGFLLIYAPGTPLPDALNPIKPLNVTDPLSPLTRTKMAQALASGATCRAALGTGAEFEPLPDLTTPSQCGIADRVTLRSVGGARMTPVETRCQTALRLAMWHRHGVIPAARTHFDQEVTAIQHASSYSCRQIRTPQGSSGRLSSHATAEAIDISGVTLGDGRRLRLLSGWNDAGTQAAFFRDLRNSACTWFRVTLGPDYNSLHADHFHLQHSGWGLCR